MQPSTLALRGTLILLGVVSLAFAVIALTQSAFADTATTTAATSTSATSTAATSTGSTATTTTFGVTIRAYIEGTQATVSSAAHQSFPLVVTKGSGTSTNQSNITLETVNGNATTSYMTTVGGFTSGDTVKLTQGATGNIFGAQCATTSPANPHFALIGFSSGNSQSAAAAATVQATMPAVGITDNNTVVIAWIRDCTNINPSNGGTGGTGTTTATSTYTITVHKYLDGVPATAQNASSTAFGVQKGSMTGSLTASTSPAYTMTATSSAGTNFSVSEIMNSMTASMCLTSTAASTTPNAPKFALVGYTSGNTMAAAASGTPSMTPPVLQNLSGDKHIIIWNKRCGTMGMGTTTGNGTGTTTATSTTIGGTVGTSTGVLTVTSIDPQRTVATADGTFQSGWRHLFHITVPTGEPSLSLKFGDWFMTNSSSTIPVANMMRFSSMQSTTSSSTVMITGANSYPTPALTITGDLDPAMAGNQVDVLIETAVATGTANGSYFSNYGVRSL